MRRALPDEDVAGHGAGQDVPTLGLEPTRQLIRERLRAAPRIVVAEEIRQAQHRVEDERDARRRRTPVRAVRREKELQLRVPEPTVQRLPQGEGPEAGERLRLSPSE